MFHMNKSEICREEKWINAKPPKVSLSDRNTFG